jgi:hypothetical protein
MPPFYPYTFTLSTPPAPTTHTCHNTTATALRYPAPSSPTGSVVIANAAAGTSPFLTFIPTPTLLISAKADTSLSTPALIGIIAALLFLFGGIAWFAFYAHVTLPRRKKAIVEKKGRARRRAKRAAMGNRERLEKLHRGSDGIFVV